MAQEILQAEDIGDLFGQAIADSRGDQQGTQGTGAHPRMTLREFYLFAVKLQVFVDEKCGAW